MNNLKKLYYSSSISITKVSPRDGLQNELKTIDVNLRYEYVKKLASVGLFKRVEIGSFVFREKGAADGKHGLALQNAF